MMSAKGRPDEEVNDGEHAERAQREKTGVIAEQRNGQKRF